MKLPLSGPLRSLVAGTAWAIALLAAAPVGRPGAQVSIGDMRRQATRSELELAVKAAEAASSQAPDEKTRAKYRADAGALRQRLTNGDFVPGDRILLQVLGDSALTDTFTVRADRLLPLPNIDDISLHGVLDSELQPYLAKQLSRYLKPLPGYDEVSVTATPLVRIAVMGAVAQPRFFTVPVDQALTDLINTAGPIGNTSQLRKATVNRGGVVFLDSKSLNAAVDQGKTVGDVSIRDGDELYVPDKLGSTFNWQTAMGVVGTLTGLYFAIRYGFRGGRRVP